MTDVRHMQREGTRSTLHKAAGMRLDNGQIRSQRRRDNGHIAVRVPDGGTVSCLFAYGREVGYSGGSVRRDTDGYRDIRIASPAANVSFRMQPPGDES